MKEGNQLQNQFNKLYFDTTKHCKDIEKWIRSGNRKQGDIRRSLGRLNNKYENLCQIKIELERNNITEQEALNNVPDNKDKVNLAQIEGKMESLYRLAGLRRPVKSLYGDNIELVTDIPTIINHEEKNNNLFLQSSKERKLSTNIKDNFSKIKDKIKNVISRFNNKERKTKQKGQFGKRVAAFAMASTLAIFGGATAGEDTSKVDTNRNGKPYTDTNNAKNDFKDSIYMQALEFTKEDTITADRIEQNTKNTEVVQETTENERKTSEGQQNEQITEKESTEEVFLAHTDVRYTEVSDGSGNSGYFSKDTRVKVYNRALIKINGDGSKQILRATKVGQSWKQFAEEKGIDYKEFKEYIDDSPNVQEYVSVQSEDGKTLYGWLSIDTLERIEEMER